MRVLLLTAADDALAGAHSGEAVQGVRASVSAITDVLVADGVHVTHAGVASVDDILAAVRGERPTLVFNLVESLAGYDVLESPACGALELLGVPYTGAGPLALGLCQHKPLAKAVLEGGRVPTAPSCVLTPDDVVADGSAARVREMLEERVGFPAIVKPACADASCGIDMGAVVNDAEAALERAAMCWEKFGPEALVERYVDGRELNVGLLARGAGDAKLDTLPLAEIVFDLPPHMPRIVTYAAKWVEGSDEWGTSRVACPAKLEPTLEAEVVDVSRRAAAMLGVRDYGRVDLRIGADGVPRVLEVNPNPDLAPDAGFLNAARAGGITYADVVHRIVASAQARASRDPRLASWAKP